MKGYHVIIVGGGPAGLTAGLYTSRAGLKTLLVERGLIGGQVANVEQIENYPGFPAGISGSDLSDMMQRQAIRYGLEIKNAQAGAIRSEGKRKVVETAEAEKLECNAVIISGGCERRKLGVPGETRFTGKGVSYCATCDGPLFRDRLVAVAGGGDAALTEALSLSRFVSSVKVIHRRGQLRATKAIQERAFTNPKIQFVWNTVIKEIQGDGMVASLLLQNVREGTEYDLPVDGVFIAVGLVPNSEYLKGTVALDENGYVPANILMETQVPGVFVAGDIRRDSPRQVVTAAGDGATAAISAEKYLSHLGN